MMDIKELYQELILDHGRHPRNHHVPEASNRKGQGYNPLCGDRVKLGLRVEGDRIVEIGFEGQGCAISQAACSTMTEAVKGKTIAEAKDLFEAYHQMVTQGDASQLKKVGAKLGAFSGVVEFPMRVKCATLGWHTLISALENKPQEVSTE